MISAPLDFIPLWLFPLLTLALLVLAVECGQRLGQRRRKVAEHETDGPVGVIVGAMLGLLALIIAFTFGFVASRFDDRRTAVLDEANAIGTTYLRTSMLAEPERTALRKLLREYVSLRLRPANIQQLSEAIEQSEQLHAKMWSQATTLGEKSPNSIVVGLFIQSLNEVIDLHEKRVMFGVRNRLPGTIWLALFFVTFISLATLGFHAGLASPKRSIAVAALVATLVAVLLLIADLERPQDGLLKVSQQPLIDLQRSLGESEHPAAGAGH